MKRIINLLYLLSLSLFFSACHNDEEWTATSGFQISLSDEQVSVGTRATPSEIGKPAADQFHLKITSHKTGAAIYDAAYTTAVIPASIGTYNLTASYGDNPVLAWDTPYYEGNIDAEVKADETTSVTIPCSVANSLLSVQFSNIEKFDAYYSSYGVNVKIGNTSLHIEKDNAGKSAYFRAGSEVELTFYATLQDNGQEVSMPIKSDKLPAAYEAGTHTKLSLTAAVPASGTILTVEKVEIEKVTVSETIPMEWLPKPKIAGFGENNTLEYVETADALSEATISYTTSSPIQEVEFMLDLKDAQYTDYNKTYTLSAMTDEERTALSNIGIALPAIDGSSQEGKIDLSALTANLMTDDGTEVENIVRVRVKANNRWSSETGEDYKIRVVKPEFSVSVQDENCWTKEFTIDEITVTTGNIEKIKERLVYQYSEDGGTTWIDCDNNKRQIFPIHPEKKDYKARALYRGFIDSKVVDVQLETETQLPNSNMNAWSHEIYQKSYYSFMPWNSEVEGFWDTSNLFTTRHRNNAGISVANYNGFHSVSYIPGRGNTGYAAEIRSTANGRGNTKFIGLHTEQNYNKVAGELFTGTAKITMGGNDADGSKDIYERIKDSEHSSRPTALHFYYKFAPYTTDTWKAHIELLDKDKKVIIENEIQSSDETSDWTEAKIELNYESDKIYAKCKYIFIIFYSTINTGSNMPYREMTQTFYVDNETKTFKPAYVGSVLTIDDVSLIYDK